MKLGPEESWAPIFSELKVVRFVRSSHRKESDEVVARGEVWGKD